MTCAAAAQVPSSTGIRRLDGSVISSAEAETFAKNTLDAAHVTGAQIAVVNAGQPVWSYAYGLRHRNLDLPMTRETTTWAASITKSVFAVYVMQLVERGEFSLDVPVAKQLPMPLDQYDAYKTTGSAVVHSIDWPAVTPRMLLAHTAGLLNFATLEPDKKIHLHSLPGTEYRYSGEGINLLQFVIEQQKKRPLDELMNEAIFKPLNMTRTGLVFRDAFTDDVADRYGADQKFVSQTRRFPARAAGSMTTSADDLAKFASALLAGKLLKPATMQSMLKPAIQIHSLHQFPLQPNEPEGKEALNVGLAYGAGWGLLTRTPFGPAFFKEGHGDGAQNYMICFERQQSCMIILTNSDNGEFAFRPLLETILGDKVTPWEWEGYTPSAIEQSRKNGN